MEENENKTVSKDVTIAFRLLSRFRLGIINSATNPKARAVTIAFRLLSRFRLFCAVVEQLLVHRVTIAFRLLSRFRPQYLREVQLGILGCHNRLSAVESISTTASGTELFLPVPEVTIAFRLLSRFRPQNPRTKYEDVQSCHNRLSAVESISTRYSVPAIPGELALGHNRLSAVESISTYLNTLGHDPYGIASQSPFGC